MSAAVRRRCRSVPAAVVLGASLALAAAAGTGLAGPAAAASRPDRPDHLTVLRAATATCGLGCADFSAALLGPGTILNAYVPGDTGQIPLRGGQDITLKYADNTRPNADFLLMPLGQVRRFCASARQPGGVLQAASAACRHYPGHEAYELDWAPYGDESGYCAGTAGSPYAGKSVGLVACGTTEGGLLIAQNPAAEGSADGCAGPDPQAGRGRDFTAYLTGANPTLRRRPYVLAVNPGTDRPDNQIQLVREDTLAGGAYPLAEEFCYQAGPVGDPRTAH